MFPPSAPGGVTHIDLSALSGIAGSISIACWVVVFSPQIIENFRRRSAEGLSVTFIIIWLVGDVFNILGAILQGVLPTMIILAVYYTLADIVLLLQVWYYRGFTFSDSDASSSRDTSAIDSERRPLLHENGHNHHGESNGTIERSRGDTQTRSGSFSALRRHLSIDGAHLSPATPLHDAPKPNNTPTSVANTKKLTTTQAFIFNSFAILLVCAAGVLGWYISSRSTASSHHKHHHKLPHQPIEEEQSLEFDLWGQIFGYLCAVLYLGSRVPQLLLNYRRKSTEGVSLLFFLFACIGNLTYDMSIFAYDPAAHCRLGPRHCQAGEKSTVYARYIAVNASWIAGSLGTLILDLAIFVQFFLYRKDEDDVDHVDNAVVN